MMGAVMKYRVHTGLSLADGKRVEQGETVTDAQLGKSVGWLAKRGHVEALPEPKPKKEKDE